MKSKNFSRAGRIFDNVLDWLHTILMAVFVVVFVFTFVFRIPCVYGHSMENTLFENDRLIVSHLFYTPQQNDIVVIDSDVMQEFIIKRIVAVANQTVVIDYNNNTVSVDDKVYNEPYLKEKIMKESSSFAQVFFDEEKDVYEYDVPFGYVFVLGDNRNNSTDSRMIGFVPTDEILGRVLFRIYSEKGDVGKIE